MDFVKATAPESLEVAARVLNSGGVAVIPTDTVYGLAAHPSFSAAVERLYVIKGRAAAKPVALLAADAAAVRAFGYEVPPALAVRWPGALTIVAAGKYGAPAEGFRVPDLEWTRSLLRLCGGLLRVTSANLSGQREATEAPQALAALGLSADVVVDGGMSPGGSPSTVVRVSPNGAVELLRQGPVVVA
jgi:L-threonylcarbamoyladenylate synthase